MKHFGKHPQFAKRTLALILIAATVFIGIPVVQDRIESQNKPFLAYAALRNRLSTLGGASISRDSYDETIKEAEEKKAQLEAEKAKVQAENAQLQSEYDKLSDYIEEMDLKQNELALEIAETNTEIEQTEAELADVQTQLDAAQAVMDQQYEYMQKRIQYIYENGKLSTFDLLLSSKNLSDFLNVMEYASSITAFDAVMLKNYTDARNTVAEYEAFLEKKNESLQYSKEMYEVEQEYAQDILDAKNAALEDYAAKMGTNTLIINQYLEQIENQEITIKEAEEEQAELIRQQEEAAKKAASNTSNSTTNYTAASTGYNNAASVPKSDATSLSQAIWPYPGCSDIYDRFGPRTPPCPGASSFHKGVDIGGRTGDQIVAILAGKVIEASYSADCGYHVYIDHGNGVVSRYLHFSKLCVSKGDYVQQGTVVGLVGSTGVATGPHLHFCIYINGTPVDPLLYVAY